MTKAVVLGAIAIALMLAACAGGSEPVAFKVCTRNDTWVRPSEEEMQETWNDPRYRWLSLEERREVLRQNFSRYIGSASLSGPFVDLSGLGSYPRPNTGECGTEEERHSAAIGEAIEIWTLLYDVSRVEKTGGGFRVFVTPVEKGFRAVQFGSQETYGVNVQVVGMSGKELECFGPPSNGGRCL